MGERAIRWTLFGVMAATLPVFYFMFVVAGFLPLIEIVRMLREGPWGFRLFNGIHIVLYGAIFYVVAWLVARALSRLPVAGQLVAVALIVGAMVSVAFQPIYGIGHSQPPGTTVYGLFFPPPQVVPQAVTIPSGPPPKPMLAPGSGAQHHGAAQQPGAPR